MASSARPRRRRPDTLNALASEITACTGCPRLVSWREEVARTRRRAYREWTYWGRAVPGFGDPRARLLILGLAPAAHGANRTGRMFTGDRSGDFLFGGLHRAGFANQARCTDRDDGLSLSGAFVTNAGRCAPPDNKPLPEELERCAPFLDRELGLLQPRVILALGSIAWEAALEAFSRAGVEIPRPRPRFGHAAEVALPGAPVLLASFHVSQQNTQTGRLTPGMFDAVLVRARALLESKG